MESSSTQASVYLKVHVSVQVTIYVSIHAPDITVLAVEDVDRHELH